MIGRIQSLSLALITLLALMQTALHAQSRVPSPVRDSGTAQKQVRPRLSQRRAPDRVNIQDATPLQGAPRDGTRDLLPMPHSPRAGKIQLAAGEAPVGMSGMPGAHGQIWREYDISKYTARYKAEDKPEQSIVNWILRETGTELWFSEPMGVLSADRNRLRVYHTREIHQLVDDVVQRYTRKEIQQYGFGLQMCSVGSPNWRAMALPKMGPATIQTPGVEAWLMSKENAAIVLAELRKRSDYRDHNSSNLVIRNGDTHELTRMRPIAYMRGVGAVPNAQVVGQTKMWQVDHGFNLELSPLMHLDGQHVDAILKVETHQVEKMKQVTVATPLADNRGHRTNIQVPQSSSWSLHERFHWPANQVLLVSCGIVATPVDDETRGPLNPLGLAPVSLPKLLSRDYSPDRADALIFIDSKGRTTDWMARGDCPPCDSDLKYQGRY